MIPSLEPRLSSSYSSLAFRTISGDESLGSRLRDSSTTAALAADVGGEYTSVRLAGQWGCGKFLVCVSFAIALVSRLRFYTACTTAWTSFQVIIQRFQVVGNPL